MSQKQLNRYVVLDKLVKGEIATANAAYVLGLSERQIQRLKKGVAEKGAIFLAHKNKGKKPIHAISDEVAQKVILKYLIPTMVQTFFTFRRSF